MEWRCCRCLALDPVPEPISLGPLADCFLRNSGRRWWKRDLARNVQVTTCAGCVLGQKLEDALASEERFVVSSGPLIAEERFAVSSGPLIEALNEFRIRSSKALTQHLTDHGQPPSLPIWPGAPI